ncbi:MAG: hypothetical protein U5L03_13320, partial [Burkholderiaceae bacterium]|nr:hypothetical protein [Burkholderiaceae bacterium]
FVTGSDYVLLIFTHALLPAQRGYRYVLLNHPVQPGLNQGLIGWHHRPLDAAAMNRAAAHLIGQHDFSAFRAAECQAVSPVKDLRLAQVARRGDYLLCDFRADGFLAPHGAQCHGLPDSCRRRCPAA